ncbi:MAG: bifunctional methylenetetrahydrofolate dehydrogenase/methenyltetrahydrofolate cyclohydrolase FolD [Elusimicrobiota bacterium]
MILIDGKKIAAELKAELKAKTEALKIKGIEPGLATVLVGEDPASMVYVSNKIKACQELGIRSFHHPMRADSTEDEITGLIEKLNNDTRVHGILLQLPLPAKLSPERCLEKISPLKDVDALHPFNIGKLCEAKTWKEILEKRLFLPCTPYGIMILLEKYGIDVSGKKAVVIGRSNLGGKPVATLLLSKNATVTIAHSKTENLPETCRQADILVAVIGKPKFVTKDFVKPGAAVIDVGINRTDDGLCGDVDFDAVKDVAGWITPVPGGVGATTITMLMNNTILAATKW